MRIRLTAVALIALAATLAAVPASAQVPKAAWKPYEAVSLFGDLLTPDAPPAAAVAQYEQAVRDFTAAPTEDHYIWLGRRAGYLGRYRDAIAIYGDGLTKFPGSYRLLRHRGHRYLSIRQFGRAIADFEQAAALVKGRPLEVEPDGAPNKAGIPLSNTQFNIYYHLGLAYYLTRDFAKAEAAYRECLRWSTNDDSIVATTDWLYLTLRHAGRTQEATAALTPIRRGMTVIEDGAYLERLLMFKGEVAEADFARERLDETAPEKAIRAYGLGLTALWRGDAERARTLLGQLVRTTSWASFATIAAEVELADLLRKTPACPSAGAALTAWALAWNTRDLGLMRTLFASGQKPTYHEGRRAAVEGFDAVMARHGEFGFVPGGAPTDVRTWLGPASITHDGTSTMASATWYTDPDVAGPARADERSTLLVLAETADGWRLVSVMVPRTSPFQ